MKRTILLAFLFWNVAQSQLINIEFRVNMTNQIKLQNFFPAFGDGVVARGLFNNWKGDEFKLTDEDGDSVYYARFKIDNVHSPIEYKFVIIPGNKREILNDGWESIENRKIGNRSDDIVLPVSLFNNIATVYPFRASLKVDIRNQIVQDLFNSKRGDKVVVRGVFNSWRGNEFALEDKEGDGAFTIHVSGFSPSKKVEYKYAIVTQAARSSAQRVGSSTNAGWESLPNRAFQAEIKPDSVLFSYFNDQRRVVMFRVDIAKVKKLGIFNPALGDSIVVKATLGGQSELSDGMAKSPSSDIYSIALAFGENTDRLTYRFCIVNGKARKETPESLERNVQPQNRGVRLPVVGFQWRDAER